ncbi:MAG: Fic family protein [Candidatus Micrarchaeaceae archaeon]
MTLVIKKIKGKKYYYSFLSYFLINKSKSFSKYIGAKKPSEKELAKIENMFRIEIIEKLATKIYTYELTDTDDVIKALLFRDLFNKKYENLTESKKRKYDIDNTILFTLTTLTTEEVDVNLNDVKNAFEKNSHFTQKEQVSKNMLNAVESIKEKHSLDKNYLFRLHKMTMASFETKTPGLLRNKQVYLHKIGESGISIELSYRPPTPDRIEKLLDEFIEWYGNSKLNPIEKATISHYKLYRIHPFLDGNKRICRLIFNKTLIDEGFPLLNVSIEKEEYFDALINSTEKDNAKVLVDFVLEQYYKQVKDFLKFYI